MRDWQNTLDRFLDRWRNRAETEAALLYGSYASGNVREDSDLDLLVLLKDGAPAEPPFLDYLNGILIEAFFLTPEQVRKFWAIHHAENTRVSAVQWADGKILFDRNDIGAQLQREAGEWIDKPFSRPSRDALYWPMRSLWQGAEHLRSLIKNVDPSIPFVAMAHLNKLYVNYATAIGEPVVETHKLHRYLTDSQMRSRYRMPPFADTDFATRAARLLASPIDSKWLDDLLRLTLDVIDRVGGFTAPGLAKLADSSDDLHR